QEVLRQQEMTVVPLAPAEVCGLLNLRGQIVTTIDLRVRMGLPPTSGQASRVDVGGRPADGAVSLLGDQSGDVLEPPAASFEDAPDTVPAAIRALVERVSKLDGQLMLVLDTELAATVGDAIPAPA